MLAHQGNMRRKLHCSILGLAFPGGGRGLISVGVAGMNSMKLARIDCSRKGKKDEMGGASFLSVFMFRTNHSLTFRSRKALLMTDTELRLIAAPAMIGLSSTPKNG